MSASNIQSQYLLTLSIFRQQQSKIINDSKRSTFEATLEALHYTQKKIDELLLASQCCTNEHAFYASQAIARIVIEHFLVGHYLFIKAYITQSDECGINYRIHYFVSEYFKRENYKLKVKELASGKKSSGDRNDLILESSPLLQSFGKSQMLQAHQIANQFDIRKILEYLLVFVPPKYDFENTKPIIIDFLEQYNNLSSYIHGGPIAQRESYFPESSSYNHQERVQDNLEYAMIASRVIKEHIMLLLMNEYKEYIDIFAPIVAERK